MDFATFGIIIDSIELPGGRTIPDLLGGGGPQTAFGMRLWSEQVGLVARVGEDLPQSAWDWLRAAGIDTSGVQVTGLPSLRAVQRLDSAGVRSHVWQVPGEVIGAQLARQAASLPEAYRPARGWHLGLHPDAPDLAFLADLRRLGGAVSVETFRPADRPPTPADLQALLGAAEVFSPNVRSARSLLADTPDSSPAALARRLVESGAAVVALRLGAQGSLAMEAASGQVVRIPAVPVRAVNLVGAGNAYCGGFLTGWVETGDLAEAARRGAVAASFVLEQFGLPVVTEALLETARDRQRALT